jgi:nucleoside-diphosphate-sugar epimerase
MKILVTGASGFIGHALCADLSANGFIVRALMRSQSALTNEYECLFGELSDESFLFEACRDVDVIIHLAGRAHQFGKSLTSLDEMRAVNRDLTLKLAAVAASAGVKRFVFVSSIGVNGVETGPTGIDESSPANPVKEYAVSKYEAECGLAEQSNSNGIEVVVVRPPLVYAGNAPGNFQKLLKLVSVGLPLPFLGVANRRSMVSLNNLTDFLKTCAVHPSAAGQLFLVSDGDDLSLPEILTALSQGMGHKAKLFYVPVSIMSAVSRLLGKSALMTQLCGSFVLNTEKARTLLNWTPPFSSRDELIKSARDFELSSGARRSIPERSL